MISDSATAVTIAPPRPWIARAAISNACVVASPQASDASVNSVMPSRKKPPMSVQVAEPAAEQQEAAERQHVRVDDPRERRVGEPEIGLDRRQRDVHDRRVEHDHQDAEAQHDQREPATVAMRRLRGSGGGFGIERWLHERHSMRGRYLNVERRARESTAMLKNYSGAQSIAWKHSVTRLRLQTQPATKE